MCLSDNQLILFHIKITKSQRMLKIVMRKYLHYLSAFFMQCKIICVIVPFIKHEPVVFCSDNFITAPGSIFCHFENLNPDKFVVHFFRRYKKVIYSLTFCKNFLVLKCIFSCNRLNIK